MSRSSLTIALRLQWPVDILGKLEPVTNERVAEKIPKVDCIAVDTMWHIA